MRAVDGGDLAQQIAGTARPKGHGGRGLLTLQAGQVTDVTAGVATVNVGGVQQIPALTVLPVAVGDNVLVATQRGDRGTAYSYVIGPASPLVLPIQGTVASVPANSYSVTVTTAIGVVSAWFVASVTPTVGQAVILDWLGSQAVIVGAQGKTGTPPAPTPKPPPAVPAPPAAPPRTGTATFPAVACGTYRTGDGWRTDAAGNVIQGTAPGYAGLNTGAFFYGGRVKASLAGARVLSVQIWLGRTSGGNFGNQAVHLVRHTSAARPGGNVTLAGETGSAALDVNERGWFTLPAAFGQALIDSGGGVAVSAPSGPYARLYGLAQSGSAGSLRIVWRR